MSKQGKADIVYKMLTKQTNKKRTSKSPPIIDLESALKKEPLGENAILRLSIEDYELMCKNKRYREAMANVLNTNIDDLTVFCRDVKILENYVDLSQITIKEKKIAKKLPIKILLSDLPDESLKLITEKFKTLLEYKLRDWLPSNKLSNDFVSANLNSIDFLSLQQNRTLISKHILSENPNAIDFLSLPENKNFINYRYLSCNKSSNPKLIELLKAELKENPNIRRQINWEELSKNPYAIDILTSPENYDYIKWKSLSSNTSPAAIKFLLSDKNIDFIKWLEFSRNSCNSAIQFLKDNPEYIDWEGLSANTNSKAISLIKEKIIKENQLYRLSPTEYAELRNKVYWRALSANPKAIDLIIAKIKEGIRLDDIDWDALSQNPSIFFTFNKNIDAKSRIIARILSSSLIPSISSAKTKITDLPVDLHKKIIMDLKNISKNKLRDGIPIDKLNWNYLSANPNAIYLLRERMYFEKNLSEDEYKKLPYQINWAALCTNSDPEAIILLSLPENYDKIDWLRLSSNPNAITLLEKRVKYQLSLNAEQLHRLSIHERVNWQKLSTNPAIFAPM
jgi:hypothetical protein